MALGEKNKIKMKRLLTPTNYQISHIPFLTLCPFSICNSSQKTKALEFMIEAWVSQDYAVAMPRNYDLLPKI